MARIIFVLVALLWAPPVHAQWPVYDPAVTFRNRLTAATKELELTTQREQHSQLRRMAQRLSLFTRLDKYSVPEPPLWRIHDFENAEAFLYSRPYHAALNYGDATGAALMALSHPIAEARALPARLTSAAQRALLARLATLEAADASAISATHDTGRLRYNGRRETAAIRDLERDVINPSNEHSTTAVLDKISGAALIGARQRQARLQLLTGLLEQLVVDSKRMRDAEVSAINMQLNTWREQRAANEAFVAGSGDALRTWRQP